MKYTQTESPYAILVLLVGIIIIAFLWSLPHSTYSIQQALGAAANTATNLTLGSPALKYTEHDKPTGLRPVVINGSHGFEVSFEGNGVIQGINVNSAGSFTSIPRADGSIHSYGTVVLTPKNGSGMAVITAKAIGHRGSDGIERDTGVGFHTKAIGDLAFLGNFVAIFKTQIDKSGAGTTTAWDWKG